MSATLRITLVLLGLTVAVRAAAQGDCTLASPANCSTPNVIWIVGAQQIGSSYVADPVGGFTVTVRNANNRPLAGCEVVLDLTAATEIEILRDQPIGGTSYCHLYSATTDARGIASFLLVGRADPDLVTTGPSGLVIRPGTTQRTATFRTRTGVVLGSAFVAALDHHHWSPGVTLADVGLFAQALGTGVVGARSDLNGNGVIDVGDFQQIQIINAAGTSSSGGNLLNGYCP